MEVRAIIDVLNNLTVGEFSRLTSRVEEVRDVCAERGFEEVALILETSLERLGAGDIRGFRRKVQHAVSRLGHAR